MMSIILYHGSEKIIECPELRKGRAHNDFGRGFYCTQSVELAKEWACGRQNDGYANEYIFDIEGLSVLDLNSPDYNILNWLAVLARHRTYWQRGSIAAEAKEYIERNFLPDISGYDVIRGYRADDSYFTFAQDFVSGVISLRKLSEAMHLGELGEQIVLKSERAFDALRYSRSIRARANEYYQKKYERDLAARRAYRENRGRQDTIDDIFILDIMRERMTSGDSRIQ